MGQKILTFEQGFERMQIKTIATLGPSCMDYEILQAMVSYGVRIFRLNFSHGNTEDFLSVVTTIRQLEQELQIPLTIMGDLGGPKIRIGSLENSPTQIDQGDHVYLGVSNLQSLWTDKIFMSVDLPEVLTNLSPEMEVTISDGVPRFKVVSVMKKNELFLLEAQNGGILSSHKGITFPGKTISLPALTENDKANLHAGLDIGLDCFALSFVQDKQDILDIKEELHKRNTWVPIIAKLERANAIENLDEILALSDGIMVARGDLGLEYPLSYLPVIQKKIIRTCRQEHKPTIVATQMLLSMVNSPLPTRAEATDVANAILDGADCLMLSEETAVGNYPLDTVRFIHEIASNTESYFLEQIQDTLRPGSEKNPAKYLAYAACLLAYNTESTALACHSTSGATAALLSAWRPALPIYALTPDIKVIRMLNFYWGIRPTPSDSTIPNHQDRVEGFIQNSPIFHPGNRIVYTSGQPTPGQKQQHTNQIKIYFK
jgi:pyruvate kinase